jgi:hypothetical protein
MPGVATREASCSCGQLSLQAEGDPFHVGICHCLACQRRTGSAFGMQAGYPADRITVSGRSTEYARTSDEADRKVHIFHFCPDCGGTVFYTEPDEPDLIVVMVGAFADPLFPPPVESGYEARRHSWVGLPDTMERDDLWGQVLPLYEAGDYAAAADRGRELLEGQPENGRLAYNVACCESLAGRTTDAVEHLRIAVGGGGDDVRTMAANDQDFDPIRDDPAFREIVGR